MQRPIGNAASGDSLGQIEEPETGMLSHAGMAMWTCRVKSEKDSLALLYEHHLAGAVLPARLGAGS